MEKIVKEEILTDAEICKQLLELAQTPAQVRYLTMNNQNVLAEKVEVLRKEVNTSEENLRINSRINRAKQEAYIEIIMKLAKQPSGCNYD